MKFTVVASKAVPIVLLAAAVCVSVADTPMLASPLRIASGPKEESC